MYRITTTDEQFLGKVTSRKAADALATQQSKQLNETIIIKRLDRYDDCYYEIARVSAQ